MAVPGLAPHLDALDAPETLHGVDAHGQGESGAGGGDGAEADAGLFQEVGQIHAVQRGDEGTCAETEGANAEFEVEQHERVAIGIEDGFDSV